MAATNPKESSKIVSLRVLLMKKILAHLSKTPIFLSKISSISKQSLCGHVNLSSPNSQVVSSMGAFQIPKKKKKNIVSKTSMS